MKSGAHSELKRLICRLYVPAVSLLLVLLLGNWWAASTAFDPLTTAQNPRVGFERGGALASAATGVTGEEAPLTRGVPHNGEATKGKGIQLLYLGNSQILGVMDRRPGDMTSPEWLQLLLARQADQRGPVIDVRLGLLPNTRMPELLIANTTMPELLIRVLAAGEQIAGRADIVLASIVLEEFRRLGVREEVGSLAESPGVSFALASLMRGNGDLPAAARALAPFVLFPIRARTAVRHGSGASVAADLERRLQTFAEGLSLFAQRQSLWGQLAVAYGAWRNRLLGITSATPRPVPGAAYRASVELIELSLRYARSKGIHVVLYLAPIRPFWPNPNLPDDVARFRRDVPALCQRYGVICLDYVDLIPEELWTNYPEEDKTSAGQPDYVHFTGAAHRVLAERLIADIGGRLVRWARERASVKP